MAEGAPQLSELYKFPVTAGLAVVAIGLALAVGFDPNVPVADPFRLDVRWAEGEPWRLLTSAALHGGIAHLAFNLWVIWLFGAHLEQVLGHVKMAGIAIALALVASAAQYGLSGPAVGLSGIGYGLFTFLWVAGISQPQKYGTLSRSTIYMLGGMFFVFIGLTLLQVLSIANVAHGAGAAMGALLGVCFTQVGTKRILGIVGAVVLTLASLAAGSVLRPMVNFSPDAGIDIARLGESEFAAHNYEAARARYLEAASYPKPQASFFYNAGVASERLGELQAALEHYSKAVELDPNESQYKMAKQHLELRLAVE